MSTILVYGMNSSSLLTAGYGAVGIIVHAAIKVFHIFDYGFISIKEKLYHIADKEYKIG